MQRALWYIKIITSTKLLIVSHYLANNTANMSDTYIGVV